MTTPAQAPEDAVVGADLERRLHAFLVDRVAGWSLAAGAGVVAWFAGLGVWGTISVVVGTLLLVSLVVAVLVGVRGVSPGRAVLGLRVVDKETGAPIGVGRALARQLLLGLATLPTLGLGTATLAWTAAEDRTRERRGWHDHRAGSVVVDVRPRAVAEELADERPRHVVNLTAMRLVPAKEPAPAAPPAPGTAQAPAPPPPPPPTAGPATVVSGARGAAAPPAAPVPGRRRTCWRITTDSGESLRVEGVALVGRNPAPGTGERVADLVPLRSADMSISKTHAQFHVAPDGALVVTDRGSTNGSVLVRQGMSRELSAGRPATLLDGDRVRVGDREIRVSREAD